MNRTRQLWTVALTLAAVLAGCGRGPSRGTGPNTGPDPRNLAPSVARPLVDGVDTAIISNGTIQLGVHKEGHLNVPGPTSSGGTAEVGLRYLPMNAEGTAAGCDCEGWGAADATSGVSGSANQAVGGVDNIIPVSFAATASTAVSVVRIGGSLEVTHDYHPSASPNLYEARVTIKNIGTAVAQPRYRRVMDWDVEPTAFAEFVTIKGTPDNLLFASNNGFASANPLVGPSDIGFTGEFIDRGPADHGALFDFGFDALDPGESITFNIYYGAAGTEAGALAALGTAGAELYSFGQPSTSDGPSLGTPNTFVFAFTGVGGPVVVPPPPGTGSLKVRQVYDYVGDRSSTPWAGFELNGDYNYPEPIVGGWPVRVTRLDGSGNPTGTATDTTTMQEMSPTDGRYLTLPAGRYRVEEIRPTSTSGGGAWGRTGANATQGGVTSPLGLASSVTVEVVAGTNNVTATVVRFFNVCRVGGTVQTLPSGAVADVRTHAWACRPSF